MSVGYKSKVKNNLVYKNEKVVNIKIPKVLTKYTTKIVKFSNNIYCIKSTDTILIFYVSNQII